MMDPGDYATNVLTSDNFSQIPYAYFEVRPEPSSSARKNLQQLENKSREQGKLVHFDQSKGVIWSFVPVHRVDAPWSATQLSTIADSLGLELVEKSRGVYEPARLAKSQPTVTNTINSGNTGTPGTSNDEALRNGTGNARSVSNTSNANLSVTQSPNESSPTNPQWKAAAASADAAILQLIHDSFISAMLGTIVHQLCRHSNLLPLNYRTLLMANKNLSAHTSIEATAEDTPELMVVTLDISLTTLGTLVIKVQAEIVSEVRNLTEAGQLNGEVSVSTSLWLAPGGAIARYHGPISSDSHSDIINIPEDEIMKEASQPYLSAAHLQSWKVRYREWLMDQGLDVKGLDSSPWVLVQILSGNATYPGKSSCQNAAMGDEDLIIPWPAQFCFVTGLTGGASRDKVDKSERNDPLDFAQDWFAGSEGRNAAISKRKKERHDLDIARQAHADTAQISLLPMVSSPVALRRGSNAGAMYPTPPDALHHLMGATPNFDGNMTTPGPLTGYSNVDGNTNAINTSQAPESESEMWPNSEKKDSILVAAYEDTDDLFGEMEGDLFGTDVTDADFNFFDQPDDFPSQPKSNHLETTKDPLPEVDTIEDDIHLLDVNDEPDLMDVEAETFDDIKASAVADHEMLAPSESLAQIAHIPDGTNRPDKEDAEPLRQTPTKQAVSPPFDKTVIFKRLMHDLANSRPSKRSRTTSMFDKIDFDRSFSSVRRKYEENGLFGFEDVKTIANPEYRTRLPMGGKFGVQETVQEPLFAIVYPTSSEQSLTISAGNNEHSRLLDVDIDGQNDLLSQSPIVAQTQNPPELKSFSSSQDVDHDSHAQETVITPHDLAVEPTTSLCTNLDTWPLASFISAPVPAQEIANLTDTERVATAQIITDQAISGSLRIPGDSETTLEAAGRRSSSQQRKVQDLLACIQGYWGGFNNRTLRSFLEIQGIPALQASRLPPRPTPLPPPRGVSTLELTKANNLFVMPISRLDLRRADSKLSVLPSAVNFWDNLGLGPSDGGKNISAMCVYPDFDGVSMHANSFLDQMRSQYESFRLGNHERLQSKELTDGLLAFPYNAGHQETSNSLASMRETIGKLGRILASSPTEQQNLVVYFAYPLDDARLLVYICTAFQHLFALYRKALAEKKMSTTNELILQLVPLDFIYNSNFLVVPSSTRYSQVALEVYSRCLNFGTSHSTSAILLEQPLPKTIDFKLALNPSAALLQENTCLHIAYAQSIDDRWITAAWTDNKGARQMTSSYCLNRRSEQTVMTFYDVAQEIWATTTEMILRKKIHWRLMIAKVGVMDTEEVESWTKLSQIESVANISLTLMTVKPNSTVCLLSTPLTLIPNASSNHSVITPASTPQPSQTTFGSQDNNVSTPSRETQNASTPGESQQEADNDAFLVDYTDQTWGAVVSHRLNNSNSLLEYHPALISGCLVKRTGMHSDNTPVIMEVNIIYSEVVGNPRTFHESLLREVLSYYRGLGTLARVRGIVDSTMDCRPWHVAVVEKAVRALYILL